jgi:hypothetical protein
MQLTMILLITCSVSLQQQDGPEPTNEDGSPFEFFPPAPVVLFCKNSPPLKQVVMQNQPISPKSASKSQATSGSAAPRVPTKTRTAVRKVVAQKTSRRRSPSPESLHVLIHALVDLIYLYKHAYAY